MKKSVQKKLITILVCLLTFSGQLSALNKVISLWEGNIPGAISNDQYVQTIDSSNNWVKMTQVSQPVLDMYVPAQEKANGTAVVICPGGGYWLLAIGHEGEQVARWLNTLGITAFVLKYRLPNDAIMEHKAVGPLQDGQEAIRLVRRNAGEFGINPQKIGIMGFSAGGHLASTISTHFDEKVYEPSDSTSARPDFSILIYPVISMDSNITHMGSRENLLGKNPSAGQIEHFSNELQVNNETPPAFLAASADDKVVPIENSLNYIIALKNAGVPCELHVYQEGGHGYGMGRSNKTESTWPDALVKWLVVNNL